MTYTDFLPPVLFKAYKKIIRHLGIGDTRIHPFNKLPTSLSPLLVIDVGANIGDVTLAALRSFPDCKVICFEPVLNSYNYLSNRLKPFANRVTLIKKALSDKDGLSEINITSFHGANSIHKQSIYHSSVNPSINELNKESIEIVRLDNYLDKFDNQRIDVLKIDVEGHELNVLRGGSKFISQYVDTIIIECSIMRDASWENQSIAEIFKSLSDLGFRFINLFDVHYANLLVDSNMMCVQFDCVFRRLSSLQK
jgi:FkbM family methyltransferase